MQWGASPASAVQPKPRVGGGTVTQYLLIYQGRMDGPMPELSQEENDPMMQAWCDWMSGVGPALADCGR